MVYFDAARSMHLFPIHGHDIFPQRHRLTFRETIKPFLFTMVVGQAGSFWIVWGVIPWTLWFGTEDANDPPTKLVDCRRIGNAAIFACPSDFCTGCTVHTLPYWWQNLTTYWDVSIKYICVWSSFLQDLLSHEKVSRQSVLSSHKILESRPSCQKCQLNSALVSPNVGCYVSASRFETIARQPIPLITP